jgi:DNA polymerase-3 subunit epsilon
MHAIFYDTETTGIRTDKDRIIEIAAYDPSTGRSFEMLINPGCPIPSEATAIHHISNAMVADALSFAEVALKFVAFCGENCLLIAHNNDSFDKPFMHNEFIRNQVPFPAWPFLDSLKWARRYRPDLPRHTLQFLRETYGIAANNAHRALDDVLVLHQVFSKMTDDLSIDQVVKLLQQPARDLVFMPFGKHQGVPLQEVPKDYLRWLHTSGSLSKTDNKGLKETLMKLGLVKVEG